MPRHIESIGVTKFWAYYYMVWSLKVTEEQKLHYNLVLLRSVRKIAISLANV